jgi:hypothetical protein
VEAVDHPMWTAEHEAPLRMPLQPLACFLALGSRNLGIKLPNRETALTAVLLAAFDGQTKLILERLLLGQGPFLLPSGEGVAAKHVPLSAVRVVFGERFEKPSVSGEP